jgi:hypothetical protein
MGVSVGYRGFINPCQICQFRRWILSPSPHLWAGPPIITALDDIYLSHFLLPLPLFVLVPKLLLLTVKMFVWEYGMRNTY